ncbi:hypothetical protein J6590_107736, partial [Homalodisca vitripennis]
CKQHNPNLVSKPNSASRKRQDYVVGSGESNTLLSGDSLVSSWEGEERNNFSFGERNSSRCPDTKFVVDKLDKKGVNESFRLGCDFSKKYQIVESSL